jgi:hypothetical protein
MKFVETPLTCSSCDKQGTYTLGWHEDEIVCINGTCGNTIHYVDLELEPGEVVNFNLDNVLCVFSPKE